MTSRRLPPLEQTPGSFEVLAANDQVLVYVYARETREQADMARVPTFDEARRIAVNAANHHTPAIGTKRTMPAYKPNVGF